MYTTLGKYGKAIEEYLDSSLLMLSTDGNDGSYVNGASRKSKREHCHPLPSSSSSSAAVGTETAMMASVQHRSNVTFTGKRVDNAAMKDKMYCLLSRRLRVFDLIRNHNLYNVIMLGGGGRIAGLLRLDERRALELFVDALEHTRSNNNTNNKKDKQKNK